MEHFAGHTAGRRVEPPGRVAHHRDCRIDSRTAGEDDRLPAAMAAAQIGTQPGMVATALAVGLRADFALSGLVRAEAPTIVSALGPHWSWQGAGPAGLADAAAVQAAGVHSTRCASGRRIPACRAAFCPVAGLAACPAFDLASGLVLAPASALGWLVNSRANQFQNDQKSQPPSPAGWHSISAKRWRKSCQAALKSPSTRSTPTALPSMSRLVC